MSNSIRFLGIAVIAWAAIRAVSLGLVPGTQALAFDVREARLPQPQLPPIQPTALPPIEPVTPQYPAPPPGTYGPQSAYQPYAAYPPYGAGYAPYPIYLSVPAAASRNSPPQVIYIDRAPGDPREVHIYGAALPFSASDAPKLAAAMPVPARQTTPSFTESRLPRPFDNLQLSSWAMMRDQPGMQSLANGGTLGGSQAGARLLWRFNPQLAASLRTSAPINSQRGGEAALGVRYQPFTNWPVALTLERRHALGGDVGRNAFALFAEGGLYGRPMPWRSTLDAYFQGGVVDFNNPDWFVDGQAAVTRPVWRNLSAGFGVWGGAQPGLSRLDAGPRASLRVGTRMRLYLDYRHKLAGSAEPGSGGVVTIAGDF
jgi:hypothetical protein